MQVVQLPLGKLLPRLDARQTDHTKIKELADSIREVGFINPLRVRPAQRHLSGQLTGVWEITAGRHRYEAAFALGLETVPCIVVEDDDLHAELVSIDENLMRRNWSDAERPLKLKRRKEIYEALHPETRVGANQHTRVRQFGEGSPAERFTADTAKVMGISERSVQRDLARAEALGAALLKVQGTSLEKGVELDALAILPPEEREALVERAVRGEKVSARAPAPKPAEIFPEVMDLIRGTDLDNETYLGKIADLPASEQYKAAERDLRIARREARETAKLGLEQLEDLKRQLVEAKSQIRDLKRTVAMHERDADKNRATSHQLADELATARGVIRGKDNEIAKLKARLAELGDGSVPVLDRLRAALDDARAVLARHGDALPEYGFRSSLTDLLEKEVDGFEFAIATCLSDLDPGEVPEATVLMQITMALGMPFSPWPELTAADLRRMVAGRQREAKSRGVYAPDRDGHPLDYSWRWRAEKQRAWLEGAEQAPLAAE